MRAFFSKYGWLCIEVLTSIISVYMILSIYTNTTLLDSDVINSIQQETVSDSAQVVYDVPIVEVDSFVVDNAILELNSNFDWKDYVHVRTSNDIDLIDYIVVDGTVDTSVSGSYELTFQLNWNGKTIVKKATYHVKE